ncbi:MAG: hypothetical protein J0H85_04435 [Sediminibacterium magnilacihabitans]|jgi:hypothetical protein|nr:hypothetical protein [Sediminibacterium magnilacihabitans]PQV61853.1 hypothetical protein CLV53_101127 [Sediminibacterium magnilacihabitans]
MNSIHIKKFGFAFGITGMLLYLGCMIVMATVGREGTIQFFNNLFHGIDTSPVIRMEVSLTEAVMGLLEVFIISWLTGASIAAIYNIMMHIGKKPQ